MSENITINIEGLNKEERGQLLRLVEKAKRPKKIWKPEYGEWYWFIGTDGQINNCEWVNDRVDQGRYSMGDCFRTKEEAESAREKQKIKIELQRFADEHNDLDKEKWDGINLHYTIRYDVGDEALTRSSSYVVQNINDIYFTSEDIVKNAVDYIGAKRIMKYLFDVDCEVDE